MCVCFFFLQIASDRRVTTTRKVSLCSAHEDIPNDIHVDLEVTLRSRDLRSAFDLDLIRSSYTYFDAQR